MSFPVALPERQAGPIAGLVCAAAVFGFGAMLDGYSQRQHPMGLLGATGIPHAFAFNLLAFVVPGLISAWIAWRLRQGLPDDTHWSARIGAWLVLIAALAFAAQGLLPLDLADLEAAATHRHATSWMLWWIAFVPGALLFALGLRNRRMLVATSVLAALAVLLFAASPWHGLPSGIAQRVAFGVWFVWLVTAARSRIVDQAARP